MRYLTLIPVAIFSLALQAQTGNVAGGTAQTGPNAAASVSAELTKRIDTKKTKAGDEVEVRTTSTAKFPNGRELPKGTKLVGKVTDAHAESKTDKTSHVAFDLERAVTKDGHEIPVHAAVTSMMASAQPVDMPMVPSGGEVSGGGSPGGSASGSPGGGTPTATGTVNRPIATTSREPDQSTQVAKGPQDRVPVVNMPGVVLTSADGVSSAGSLDAEYQNFSLESGTKMTLKVSEGQQ